MDIDDDMTDAFVPSSSRKRRHIDSSTNDETPSAEISLRKSLDVLERAVSPNFEELARQYPSFRRALAATKSAQKDRGHAAFSSCVTQEFSISLTRAILQALFRLKLPYLDEDHLCPPIPNRFFYLHWIHSKLMQVSWIGVRHQINLDKRRGLDIGSGASCIYSMLASRFFRSTMITTEIDPKSVGLARANVAANHLSSMITVLQIPPSHSQQEQLQQRNSSIGGPLQRSIEGWFHFKRQQNPRVNHIDSDSNLDMDFVMTNPPFYDPSAMEISTARVGDGRSRTNMTVSEGNYPGGEVGFLTEMIEDSLRMSSNENIRFTAAWYSSMLGKKTSLVKLHKLLVHLLGPAHVETAEYGPGHFTRWFLAWTLAQPPSTASGALCPKNDKDSFQVPMAEPTLPQIAVKEVVNRISTFCDSGPGGWDLTTSIHDNTKSVATSKSTEALFSDGNNKEPSTIVLQIVESMPPSVNHFVDENQNGVEIPESILRVLRDRNNSQFLPDEGHFLVEVEIRAADTVDHIDADTQSPASAVDVHLSCYRHSARGAKAIEKIRNSLGGEVCRTNRKWRKIRQRQNH
jgi:23S rRNA A1618 N6-methylase RlmF